MGAPSFNPSILLPSRRTEEKTLRDLARLRSGLRSGRPLAHRPNPVSDRKVLCQIAALKEPLDVAIRWATRRSGVTQVSDRYDFPPLQPDEYTIDHDQFGFHVQPSDNPEAGSVRALNRVAAPGKPDHAVERWRLNRLEHASAVIAPVAPESPAWHFDLRPG